MNSTPHGTLGLIREHPVLLLGPMLGAATINFIVYRMVGYFRDLYFPQVSSQAMRAIRLAARADGGAAVTALSAALHSMAIRGLILFGTQVFQLMLELCAVALTVALAAELYRRGTDTFAGAIERLRMIPHLFGILFRLAFRILVVGVAVGVGMAMACGPLLLLFGVHRVPNPTLHPLFWWPAAVALLYVAMGVVASFVMPYFLDVAIQIQIQKQAPPSHASRMGLTTQAIRFAWIAVGAYACLGLLAGGINIALTGAPVLTDVLLRGIERTIMVLAEEIPIAAFVVAVTLLVASTNEPVIESEPGRVTS